MSIRATLQGRANDALKAGRKQEVRVLRVLVSELQLAAKDSGLELDAEGELKVLRRERKKRLESIEAFRAGGREDLVADEEFVVGIIEGLLPRELSHDELLALIDKVIGETGASSAKDTGAVMKRLMQEGGGVVDGKMASALVKERLTG